MKDSCKGGRPRSGPPPLWEAAEGCLLCGSWRSACFSTLAPKHLICVRLCACKSHQIRCLGFRCLLCPMMNGNLHVHMRACWRPDCSWDVSCAISVLCVLTSRETASMVAQSWLFRLCKAGSVSRKRWDLERQLSQGVSGFRRLT
jgi:hypothetical protein